MQETITLSVEELNRIIDERVQVTLTNSKPVRDNRMKELENYLKAEYEREQLRSDVSCYSLWTTIRTAVAMRMGYASTSKVPASEYDEFLTNIKHELDVVIAAFKSKRKE